MTVHDLLSKYDRLHSNKCYFTLDRNSRLRDVNRFPLAYGLYIIEDLNRNEILYIGKSGTLRNTYSTKDYRGNPKSINWLPQTLRQRIKARYSKSESRERFYKRMMRHDRIQALHFRCWQLSSPKSQSLDNLPAEAEAELISAFIRQYGHLPKWNRSF